jgi:hypothetical protein
VAASLAVGAAIPFDLAPWLRGPAPYPPEWQWGFRPGGPAHSLLPALGCALILLGLLAATGAPPLRRHARLGVPAIVAIAILAGWGLQVALLAREPGSPLRTLLDRTRSRTFTSHHAVAVSDDARDPLLFLRRHADLLPTQVRTAKHSATHPPGPVLFYRAALAVCERSPALRETLLAAASLSDPAAPPPDARPAWAAALLGALVLGLLGAAAAWPVFHLARRLGAEPLAAARVGVLWGLVPGPALMTPQFDQALALPVAGATALLLQAAARPGRCLGLAALGGVLGGLAMFTSYGAAAFLVVCGAAALLAPPWAAAARRPEVGRRATIALAAAAVAGVVALGAPALLGHHPLRALATALQIHREVYTAPRDYLLWLLFDPLDLALFLGVPVALALPLRAAAGVRRPATTASRFRLALLAGLFVLVGSGVTRGEVGRLWIPLMPALLAAAVVDGEDGPRAHDALGFAAILAVLTLVMGAYWNV